MIYKLEYNLANRAAGVRRLDVGVDAHEMSPVSLQDILAFWDGSTRND